MFILSSNTMRRNLFLLNLAFIALACNKKDNDVPTIANAEFTTSKDLFYAVEPLTIRAVDTTGNTAYHFDFGDGTQSTGSYTTTHQYNRGGTFIVTMSIYGKTYSKSIRVLAGALSYQIKNSSARELNTLTYIDNPSNGTAYRKYYAAGRISDTLYATTLETTGNILHLYGASVFISNQEYIVNPLTIRWIAERQHHILEVKDSTQVSPKFWTGSPTVPIYYLKDL